MEPPGDHFRRRIYGLWEWCTWLLHNGTSTPKGGPELCTRDAGAPHGLGGGGVRALPNRFGKVYGAGNRIRPHMLMAVVCRAPQTRFHASFKVGLGARPIFAYAWAPHWAQLRARPGGASRRTPADLHNAPNDYRRLVARHEPHKVRGIVDNGLLPSGPSVNRNAVHIYPVMPWDMDRKANFWQRATTLIYIDPESFPNKVPGENRAVRAHDNVGLP